MKQMDSLLEEVNFSHKKPKLVKCLAVHNEEDWVEFNLKNNYHEYDTIRVVEGAVDGRPKSTPCGHSTDSTLEKIRSFDDPDDKVELYQLNRPFKSLEEQKQTFLDVANEGEWLLITDCDEFYLDGAVNRIRRCIEARPSASEIIPTFFHFYRDFWHIKAVHPEWNCWHQRILRYRNGLRYHTHPVATDANGVCTYFGEQYQTRRFFVPNLYIYHYGHAKGKDFHRMKQEFYKKELEKFALEDGTNASDKFDEKFLEFVNNAEDLSTILSFKGQHPKIMEAHPSFSYMEPTYSAVEFKDWREAEFYREAELPTIPLWMIGQWKRTNAFFNTLDIK